MGFLKNNKINVTHGESKTRLYIIWNGIKGRCLDQKNGSYYNYGGKGITICPEWTNDYTKFRDWALSHRYEENLEIDRIDDSLGYTPNNCQWITSKENNRKRKCVKLNIEKVKEIRHLYKTGNYTQKEIGIIYNIEPQTVSKIIHNIRWKIE